MSAKVGNHTAVGPSKWVQNYTTIPVFGPRSSARTIPLESRFRFPWIRPYFKKCQGFGFQAIIEICIFKKNGVLRMCGTESNCVLSGVWVFTPRHMHMSTLSRTSVQTVPFLRIKICIDPRRSNVSTESARSTLDFIGFQFEFERKKMQTFKDKHGHMTTPQQKSPSNAICQPSQHAGHRSHSKI